MKGLLSAIFILRISRLRLRSRLRKNTEISSKKTLPEKLCLARKLTGKFNNAWEIIYLAPFLIRPIVFLFLNSNGSDQYFHFPLALFFNDYIEIVSVNFHFLDNQ